MVDLAPDFAASVDFLESYAPGGPWCLVAIEPDPAEGQNARAPGRTFVDPAEAIAWLEEHRDWNLYYAVNETAVSVRTTPTKDQILFARMLHVDVDVPDNPERAVARLRSMSPAPSFIVCTGGGGQAGWRFPEKLARGEVPRVEATNRAIADAVAGGDHCWNINRLMRLPGTVNWLSRAKRARGRQPAMCTLIEADWTRTWSYVDAPVPTPAEEDGPDDPTVEPLDRRDGRDVEDLPAKLRKIIVQGDVSRWDGDRNRGVFYVCCALLRMGWSDEAILPLITERRYLISAHVREQSNPEAYARRQIRDARARVATDWERSFDGAVRPRSQRNIRRALSDMGVALSHDTFALKSYINGRGPACEFTDDVRNRLWLEVDQRFGFLPEERLFKQVSRDLCRAGDYHPVRDWLAAVEPTWDRVERASMWLIACAGATDTPYVRAVSRIVLVAAVRRVRHPGCKFDEMLVLVDPQQGTEKSTALRRLVHDTSWFTDSLPLGVTPKEVIEAMSGKWICESAELEGMGRRETNTLKNFLSRQSDGARLAYREDPIEVPRQFIVIGTTNELAFLRDTQNRRYWPVRVGKFDIPLLESMVHQLWAEAATLEAAGESIRLPSGLWEAAAEVQAAARAAEPWAEVLNDALGGLNGRLASSDAWKIIDKPVGTRFPEDNRRLGAAIRELGFERTMARLAGRVMHAYVRGSTAEERRRVIYAHRDPVTKTLSVGHTPPDLSRADNDRRQGDSWSTPDPDAPPF